MNKNAEIRLDILIRKVEDHYEAHCLQFDIVATDDAMEAVQKTIIELCVAHIRFSLENDNMAYLFSPAPQEAWAEYFALANDPGSMSQLKKIDLPPSGPGTRTVLPAFIAQEILSNDSAPRRNEI